MKDTDFVSWRRSFGLLAAVLAVVSACGRKKEANSGEKLVRTVPADAPLTDTIVRQASAATVDPRSEGLPAWTQEVPHFFDRGGRRYASAVGWAVSGDVALARSAAEDRARVDLLRLIKGGVNGDAVVGELSGARMTDSFVSQKDKKVYVLVEVPAP